MPLSIVKLKIMQGVISPILHRIASLRKYDNMKKRQEQALPYKC